MRAIDDMYRGQTVAVVVPAYNEAGFVGDVIEAIPGYVDRIYAVDDCSTDGTWQEILDSADAGARDRQTVTADGGGPREPPASTARPDPTDGSRSPSGRGSGDGPPRDDERPSSDLRSDGGQAAGRVVPIRHDTNRGVGGAIKTGYRRALEERIDVTAVIAGDGQMDPAILDRFVDPVVEGVADYTKGNRLETAELHQEMSTWRRTGNVVLTLLTKIASGYWGMTDPQNGYTAISLRALDEIDLDSLYDRYGFSNDILVRCNAHGLRVADVPMRATYGDEESHIRYSSFVPRLSTLLLRDFCWRLKVKYFGSDFHPLVLLYALGTVGSVTGLAYGLWVLVRDGSLFAGGLSILILLVSVSMLVFAMVFDRRHNEHLEQSLSY